MRRSIINLLENPLAEKILLASEKTHTIDVTYADDKLILESNGEQASAKKGKEISKS